MKSQAFQDGALFAMKVLQEAIEKRRGEITTMQESMGLSKDLNGIMNSLDNQLCGLRIELELTLVRELTRK